jgi:dihydroorotate dehydrogenase
MMAARAAQKLKFPLSVLRRLSTLDASRLESKVWEMNFPSPLGLAAGFDKNGEVVDFMAALGFGFVEVGAVTAVAAAGNSRPRLFRLPDDGALINRLGLNNCGPERMIANLMQQRLTVPVVVNIAKTNDPQISGDEAVDDFIRCFTEIAPAASLAVLNLSCPNTGDGRTFEEPAILDILLRQIMLKREELLLDVPVLLKFSNDIARSQLEAAIAVGEASDVDGYVLGNTSVLRDGLRTSSTLLQRIGPGGLSGRPLFERTLDNIRFAAKLLGGKKPLIGCGGVSSGEDMYRLLRAGASLVELYTALVYEGPGVCKAILGDVLRLFDRDGVQHISQIIGIDRDGVTG